MLNQSQTITLTSQKADCVPSCNMQRRDHHSARRKRGLPHLKRKPKGNMERFVVRGDAAISYDGDAKTRGKSMRQTRIVDGSKVVVEEQVQHLKDELDDARTTANMLSILDALETQFISLEMLEKTLIGRSLTRLERRAESVEVKERAQRLLRIWKVRAKIATRRRERRVRTYGRNAAE